MSLYLGKSWDQARLSSQAKAGDKQVAKILEKRGKEGLTPGQNRTPSIEYGEDPKRWYDFPADNIATGALAAGLGGLAVSKYLRDRKRDKELDDFRSYEYLTKKK